MDYKLFDKLHQEGLIGEASFDKINQERKDPSLSVYWDINVLLGIGVIGLSTGLGILIYKNIETIGHQVVLALICSIAIACFIYCEQKKVAFSRFKVANTDHLFDYLLLLGTLCLIIFTAYLQYQYEVFGTHYGIATFLPMVLLFFIAYNYDHLAILNMAIANFALWMGVSVTPRTLLIASNFNSETIIYTYVLLGFILLFLAFLTTHYQFKPHFRFSYQHYGVHVTFIAMLSAYFFYYQNSYGILWLFAALILAVLLYKTEKKHHSLYFPLLLLLYSYFAICCMAERLLSAINKDGEALELMLIFVPLSALGFVYLLKRLNQKIKSE
jgi:hypothetical protein